MGTHISDGDGPGDDVRRIMDALRRLVRSLRVFSRQAEAHTGLSAAQLFVLQRLAEHQPLSVNELAERTFTHQSSVSVVVTRLVEQGLVRRMPSPRDRRRMELSLEPAGRTALRRVPRSVQDRLIAGMQAMPASRRRELAHLLETLVESAGLHEAPAGLFFEHDTATSPKKRNRPRK
jgi:DNA-binding MarR family transcriptional regulator